MANRASQRQGEQAWSKMSKVVRMEVAFHQVFDLVLIVSFLFPRLIDHTSECRIVQSDLWSNGHAGEWIYASINLKPRVEGLTLFPIFYLPTVGA